MKKIVLIVIISFSIINTEAQVIGVSDTLFYLQSIVANKSQFIGHTFSELENSMQIQIKHFSRNTDLVNDKNKETSTSFGFYFPQNNDEVYLSYPRLRISWQPYLNATISDNIWGNNNGGSWNSSASTFYSTGIISDIQIRE